MIRYQMMDKSNILSRCLHGGSVPINKMEIQVPEFNVQYPIDKTVIQIPKGTVKQFLTKICDLYDSCAVLAYDANKVIGLLRFYPSEILDILDDNSEFRLDCVCVQQGKYMKNISEFLHRFPSKDSLRNKTIEIECFQIIGYYHKGNEQDYGGQGIANSLLKTLIEWAKDNNWYKIVANAINHIKPLLLWSGMYSLKRYKKLGFKIVKERINTSIKEGVNNQRKGYHGKKILEMWEEYNHISNDEAARVYNIELNLD